MLEAASLAGFFTAHAVWSVSDGATLVPIYGYINDKNEKAMERLVCELLEQGVVMGQEKLDSNPYKTNAAVLIYDGRITIDSKKIDALIIKFKNYKNHGDYVTVAVPYTPATDSTRFAVHRIKVLELPEHLREGFDVFFNNFFEGVGQHEKGASVWKQHLDDSI